MMKSSKESKIIMLAFRHALSSSNQYEFFIDYFTGVMDDYPRWVWVSMIDEISDFGFFGDRDVAWSNFQNNLYEKSIAEIK